MINIHCKIQNNEQIRYGGKRFTWKCHQFYNQNIKAFILALCSLHASSKFKIQFVALSLHQHISWAESQKGVSTIQQCSVENQKGAIAVHGVYGFKFISWMFMVKVYGDSTLLVLNGTSLNSITALCCTKSMAIAPLLVLNGTSSWADDIIQVTQTISQCRIV